MDKKVNGIVKRLTATYIENLKGGLYETGYQFLDDVVMDTYNQYKVIFGENPEEEISEYMFTDITDQIYNFFNVHDVEGLEIELNM